MTSQTENQISHAIIGCALKVHTALGPGLLESAYQRCLELAMRGEGISFERERSVPLIFESTTIPDVYRLDFVVDGRVIVEVKSVRRWEPVFDAQLMTYLRLTGLRLGLLLNFNVPHMKDGIRRILLGPPT